MKVAIYQMADRGEPEANLSRACEALGATEADWFVLPELFLLPGGDYARHSTAEGLYAEMGLRPYGMLAEASRSFPGYVVAGTLVEEAPEGYYNTCYVLRDGSTVAKYRKINLTQVELDMQFLAGSETVVFDTEWGRTGLLVCFDIVIEETRDEVGKRADLVFLPVGMAVPDHPKVDGYPCSGALAQKHQTMVVQVSRVGFYEGKPLVSPSAVIAPWGVVWEASRHGEQLAVIDLPDTRQMSA